MEETTPWGPNFDDFDAFVAFLKSWSRAYLTDLFFLKLFVFFYGISGPRDRHG